MDVDNSIRSNRSGTCLHADKRHQFQRPARKMVHCVDARKDEFIARSTVAAASRSQCCLAPRLADDRLNVSVPLLGLVDAAILGHLPDARYLGGGRRRDQPVRLPVLGLRVPAHGNNGACCTALGGMNDLTQPRETSNAALRLLTAQGGRAGAWSSGRSCSCSRRPCSRSASHDGAAGRGGRRKRTSMAHPHLQRAGGAR